MMLSQITNLLHRFLRVQFRQPGEQMAGDRSAFADRAKNRIRLGTIAFVLVFLLSTLQPSQAFAVSCTPQSQIAPAERSELAAAVLRLATLAAAGDTASLRTATLPAVAKQFDGIAATVESLAPALKGAAFSIENLYLLHAEDLKATEDEAQFFCSVPGSSLLVSLSIPQLPPGTYALAIAHGTGTAQPEQLGMILARGAASAGATGASAASAGGWQLAGFFARPLTAAGHDGVWYWTRARELGKSQQRWSAYFYYQTAQFLLTPVDFLSSPNLLKLEREAASVRPEGLPGSESAATMTLAAGDQSFSLTNLRTDSALGGLDLVLHYNANASSVDPVFARSQAVQLMQAMLKQHPELRANFHGLWVYADSPGRQPFAVELPMDQIQ